MSRIGKQPIEVPQGVDLTLNGQTVRVKGPRGELTFEVHPDITVTMEDGVVTVTRPSDKPRHRALHGLNRMLVANMIEGGKTPILAKQDLVEMGFQLILYPLAGLFAAARAIETIYQKLKDDETTLGREEIEALGRGEPLPPQPVPVREKLAPAPSDSSKQPEKAPPPLGLPGADGPLPGPATSVYEAPDHNS